jgi:putative transposase
LFWKFGSRNRGGRPQLDTETITLVQPMARENRLWGAERIRGELLKLGLTVAKHTIQKYIARVRPDKPTSQTWATFLKNHAKDIWACDFCRSSMSGFVRSISFLSSSWLHDAWCISG